MNAHWRLFTYRDDRGMARSGISVGVRAFDLVDASSNETPAEWMTSVLGVLEHWPEAEPRLGSLATRLANSSVSVRNWPIEDTTFLPPVLYPNAVYCAGANYTDHVAEMERAFDLPHEPDPHEVGATPWHFIKAPRQSFIGHGAEVPLPAYSAKVDWEAELGAVIGRVAKAVSREEALDHVAGYTILNDLSARDFLRRPNAAPGSPFEYDWISQKNFDGSCPIGPWIVPASQIPDPGRLGIRLWVNDELMQDSNTSRLIFDTAEQVSHLSQRLTLFPGDIVATGTPAGVGLARGRFLNHGDRVKIEIDRIGVLHHRVVDRRG